MSTKKSPPGKLGGVCLTIGDYKLTARNSKTTPLSLRTRLGVKVLRKSGKKVSGTLWPNGEFSFAYVPEDVTEVTRGEECSWAQPGPGDGPEGAEPLDLTLVHNSDTASPTLTSSPSPRRYGLKGMTSEARRKVRASAYLLQERYGKDRLSFVTLTVPPLSGVQSERRLASRWHDAIRLLVKRLKRLLHRRGLPLTIVGVCEIQVKRYASSGQFPLHIHLILVGRKRSRGGWAIHYSEIRKAWAEVLEGIVGHPIETRYLENVKGVQKDAGAYLGKYMSKSQNEIEKVVDDGKEWMLPKQWWFSTAEMKRWLKSRTCRGGATGVLLECLVHQVWDNPGLYPDMWLRRLSVLLDGFDYTAGWMGKIPIPWVHDLFGLLKLTV